jgi:ABC-2 type transport system permease protein
MITSLIGTPALIRLALRLNRIRLTLWLLAVPGIGYGTASAFRDLYPTAGSRIALASTLARAPELIALTGPGFDLSSIGGLTAWRIGGLGSVMVGLLGIFTVTHHTRLQEENGRLELVGSGRVGRGAPLAAALAVALGVTLLVGLALGAALVSLGEPAAGSFALGLAFTSVGWSFAALASVTAQLTQTSRAANGSAGAFLGAAFLLRAVGDSAGSSGLSVLSWLSPIGWGQQVRPFADERWEVFGLSATLVVLGTAAAFALNAHRDLGGSLLAGPIGPRSRLDPRSTWPGGFIEAPFSVGCWDSHVWDSCSDRWPRGWEAWSGTTRSWRRSSPGSAASETSSRPTSHRRSGLWGCWPEPSGSRGP